MIHRAGYFFTGALIITGMLFSACGGSEQPPAAPADNGAGATTAVTESSTAASDTTATPAATVDNGAAPAQAATADNSAAAPTDTASAGNPTPAAGSGNMLADLGFRPDKDGFPFPNYGSGYTNLTAAEMNQIYGDSVCANKTGGTCTLIPPAQQWMDQVNTAINGGHCYGFAEASLLAFEKQLNPSDFGATSMADLKIDNNDKLQREIAKDWTGQKFDTVRTGVIGGTPTQILDKLITALKTGPSGETYIFAFFKRDGSGGHAVTPYAVQDRGNGINAVLLYDNNYPKDQREMIIDRNANTWKYEASINPSVQSELYEGDAQTQSLFLYPVSPATKQQACPFCSGGTSSSTSSVGTVGAAKSYDEIWLDGLADLMIVDSAGHKLGRENGKMINEIPGAYYDVNLSDSYDSDVEPTYYVPTEINFNITVDGSNLKAKTISDVVVIGPGYDLGVEGVTLDPGQKDEMTVLPKDNIVSYKTTSSESPNFIIGLQREGADYEFEVKGADMQGGGALNVYVDPQKGDLVVNAEEIKTDATIGIVMNRIDDKTEETFENDGVSMKAGDLLYVDYADWKGNHTPINMTIMDSKGNTIDKFSSDDTK